MSNVCQPRFNSLTLPQGGSAVEFTEAEAGYKLDASIGNYQISVQSLGNTTWSVALLLPGKPDWWWTLASGKGAQDVVLVDDGLIHKGIKVTPADAGEAAGIIVTIAATGRLARFTTS